MGGGRAVAREVDSYGAVSRNRISAERVGGGDSPVESAMAYRRISSQHVLLPSTQSWLWTTFGRVFLRRPSPHSNGVSTTKYTLLSFIPKNLYEQFHRFANLYFLLIVILSMIPALEVFGREVAAMPLLFVLSVTLLKDLLEDYSRFRSDREVNLRPCPVYSK